MPASVLVAICVWKPAMACSPTRSVRLALGARPRSIAVQQVVRQGQFGCPSAVKTPPLYFAAHFEPEGAARMQAYDVLMLVVVVLAIVWGAWKGLAWQVASIASIAL